MHDGVTIINIVTNALPHTRALTRVLSCSCTVTAKGTEYRIAIVADMDENSKVEFWMAVRAV